MAFKRALIFSATTLLFVMILGLVLWHRSASQSSISDVVGSSRNASASTKAGESGSIPPQTNASLYVSTARAVPQPKDVSNYLLIPAPTNNRDAFMSRDAAGQVSISIHELDTDSNRLVPLPENSGLSPRSIQKLAWSSDGEVLFIAEIGSHEAKTPQELDKLKGDELLAQLRQRFFVIWKYDLLARKSVPIGELDEPLIALSSQDGKAVALSTPVGHAGQVKIWKEQDGKLVNDSAKSVTVDGKPVDLESAFMLPMHNELWFLTRANYDDSVNLAFVNLTAESLQPHTVLSNVTSFLWSANEDRLFITRVKAAETNNPNERDAVSFGTVMRGRYETVAEVSLPIESGKSLNGFTAVSQDGAKLYARMSDRNRPLFSPFKVQYTTFESYALPG